MSGTAQLSLEQAFKTADFMSLKRNEKSYFLTLVQWERAGDTELKAYFREELERISALNKDLKTRLQIKDSISPAASAKYYSHWIIPSIHIALFIKEFTSPQSLAEAFGIQKSEVVNILEFLIEAGLAKDNLNGTYEGLSPNQHLNKDSPMIIPYHTSWRIKAIQELLVQKPGDVHYSFVMAVAKADKEKFQNIILKAIDQVQAKMSVSSPEDVLLGFNADLFEVT